MKYVAIAMLAFLAYVFVRKQYDVAVPLEGQTVNKMHAPEETIIPSDVLEAYRDVDDLPLGVMDTPLYWVSSQVRWSHDFQNFFLHLFR